MTLLEMHYQRRKARSEAARLLDSAFAEARNLTLPEQVRFDALTARMQEMSRAIADRESLRKLAH